MKGDIETRWVAYEVDGSTVVNITAIYEDHRWLMAAIVTDLAGLRLEVSHWIGKCSEIAAVASIFVDLPDALALDGLDDANQEWSPVPARRRRGRPAAKNKKGYRRTGPEGTPRAANVVRRSTVSLAKSGTSRDN
jgi:hypothetical protein